ncbi:MAG: N-acetylmuramoyl-L-alanine amidase [Endomicrobium sp.]|jgi:N-acetylmuramoyl-L-alanine amidase|nr:N-acetylmuramoyl-L-alanine amidase [Endomicrobium sp.]
MIYSFLNLRKILLRAVLAAALLFCSLGVLAHAAKDNQGLVRKKAFVVLDGKNMMEVDVFQSQNSTYYFSIKDIAKIYNAAFEWKPISSIVTMRVNNKKMDFSPDDKTVLFGRDPKEMKASSRLVRNNIYIPVEILTTKEFAQTTEINARWSPTSSRLILSYIPNVSSVKYLTKPNESQISVELSEMLNYTVSKSADTIILKIMRGKTENKTIEINNQAISSIVSSNDGKAAAIRINLAQEPKSVRAVRSPTIPDKITIIIEHSKPIIAAANGKPVPVISETQNQKSDVEIISPVEAGIDNSDLSKVPTEKFDLGNIKDDSFAIVDDVSSFKDLAAATLKGKSKDAKIIVIDAGHGGADPGAVGPGGTKEKDVTLEIAYELKRFFDKNKDYVVILTRKDDVFIPLAERTEIANEKHGNLFISIHCNANINRKVGGFEVFFLSEKASDAEALATANLENSVIELEGKPTPKLARIQKMLWSMMQNEYLNESSELSSFIDAVAPGKLKIQNRGVKQAGFYVLRGTQMPAVLVESAFISNYSEEAKLKNKNFQRAVAQSIYEGVLKYYERKNKLQKK